MCAQLCVPCFVHAQLCMPFPGSCECMDNCMCLYLVHVNACMHNCVCLYLVHVNAYMHNCVCFALCPGEHCKVPGGLPAYLEQLPDCNSETPCPLWLRGVDFPGSSVLGDVTPVSSLSLKMYCHSGKGSQILPLFSYHFIRSLACSHTPAEFSTFGK